MWKSVRCLSSANQPGSIHISSLFCELKQQRAKGGGKDRQLIGNVTSAGYAKSINIYSLKADFWVCS